MRSARIFFQSGCEIVLDVDDFGNIARCDNVLMDGRGLGYLYPGTVKVTNNAGTSITVDYEVIDNDIPLSNYKALANYGTLTANNFALKDGCLYLRFAAARTLSVTGGSVVKYIPPATGIQGHSYFIKPDNINAVTITFS